MENKITYRVKVTRTEFEERDEVQYRKIDDNEKDPKYEYVKTGSKLWKEKESKEIFNQEFDEVNVADLAKHLNS